MPSDVAPMRSGGDIIEQVITKGDLAKLTPQERVAYYNHVCNSLGLNPFTRPLEYLTLSGKTVLYARRDAADQLRKINGISVEVVSQKVDGDMLTVHVRARDKTGRSDEDFGVVSIAGLRGEARANATLKCVPLDTEILTMEGWKTHDQLRIGEAVLGYNANTDRTEWTLLEAVNLFGKMEMGTLQTVEGRFSVRCSPGHRWVMEREAYRPRSTGARGARGPYANRQVPRHLVNVEDIGGSGRLVLAAPEIDQIDSLLTPTEAAVLGWAVTDGTIQRRGSHVRVGICQSKEANFAEIETAVSGLSETWTKCVTPATTRTFPSSGQTYDCLPQHWWYLPAEVSRSLLRKCGFSSRDDLPRIITRLNPAARRAMLQAFMLAEGGVRPNAARFINTDDVLMDCFQLLCALEGISTGNLNPRTIYDGYRPWMSQTMKKRRHIAAANLRWLVDGIEPAWCPTTGLDTWVMRQYGTVTITGNCITKAKRRVTLSIAGLGFLDETEVDLADAETRMLLRGAETPDTTADLDQFAADTGEVIGDTIPPPERDILAEARAAADAGTTSFRAFWRDLSPPERDSIRHHLAVFHDAAKTADDPFGLPPIPAAEEVTEPSPPQFSRSAIWQQLNYHVAPTDLLDGTTDWNSWAFEVIHLIGEATSDEINKLRLDNRDLLNILRRSEHSDRYREIHDAETARRADLKADAV